MGEFEGRIPRCRGVDMVELIENYHTDCLSDREKQNTL